MRVPSPRGANGPRHVFLTRPSSLYHMDRSGLLGAVAHGSTSVELFDLHLRTAAKFDQEAGDLIERWTATPSGAEAAQPLCAFSWHQTDRNRLAAISANGRRTAGPRLHLGGTLRASSLAQSPTRAAWIPHRTTPQLSTPAGFLFTVSLYPLSPRRPVASILHGFPLCRHLE